MHAEGVHQFISRSPIYVIDGAVPTCVIVRSKEESARVCHGKKKAHASAMEGRRRTRLQWKEEGARVCHGRKKAHASAIEGRRRTRLS